MSLFLCSYTVGVKKLVDGFLKSRGVQKILFIPTAGNVEHYKEYITQAEQAFKSMGYQVNVIDIAEKQENDIVAALEKAQTLYISGGNTFYLLQELKRKNILNKIKERVLAGMPYIGESAGAVIAYDTITYNEIMDDRHMAVNLADDKALGIFNHGIVPHFGEPPFTETSKRTLEAFKDLVDLIVINNHQAVIVNNSNFEIKSEE